MTKSKQNKKSKLPLIAGITSAIGAAIAGVVVFKDKKNRDKAKKIINSTTNKAKNYVKKISKKTPSNKTKNTSKKSK